MKLHSSKKIVCVLPLGKGSNLVNILKNEKNINTSDSSHARGAIKKNSQFDFLPQETDIVTVIIDETIAEEIFEYIYYYAEIDKTPGCFMYQTHISDSSEFSLPELTTD
ncbi:MAG: hypothetical protein COA79_01245 [Planctomycetota bacterium]|nr:MAG: hypothetical protein COA79_01245 [Planctomycetota bacterium]